MNLEGLEAGQVRSTKGLLKVTFKRSGVCKKACDVRWGASENTIKVIKITNILQIPS